MQVQMQVMQCRHQQVQTSLQVMQTILHKMQTFHVTQLMVDLVTVSRALCLIWARIRGRVIMCVTCAGKATNGCCLMMPTWPCRRSRRASMGTCTCTCASRRGRERKRKGKVIMWRKEQIKWLISIQLWIKYEQNTQQNTNRVQLKWTCEMTMIMIHDRHRWNWVEWDDNHMINVWIV